MRKKEHEKSWGLYHTLLYMQLGGAEWGYHLYCAADAVLTERFNPRIGFRRTTTLMEGHACCDHQYYDKE